MGPLDQLNKIAGQWKNRAAFEMEKFQRTSRITGDLNDLKNRLDQALNELGQRAYDLHRAGQIKSPTIAELTKRIDEIQSRMVQKEEELKVEEAQAYVEPTDTAAPRAQAVTIHEPEEKPQSAGQTKSCPKCQFQMPQTALFCPRCGCHTG